MQDRVDGREDKGNKMGKKEGKKEGDVSVAFHSKVNGSQEVGMQHRSKTDSRLKVY